MRVLCFQPHNDDCAIAVGGIIQKMLRRSWDLTYVYLTDGRHGSEVVSPERLIRIRQQEANKERNILGIEHQVDLGLEDGTLAKLSAAESAPVRNHLAAILAENEADIVLLPTASDMHPDHSASHRLVVEALEESSMRPLLIKYFVWLLPDFYQKQRDSVDRILMVGIDGELPLKMAAIRSHRSQISRVAFDSMALMLNGYLGYLFRSRERIASGYVEIVGISGVGHRRREFVELKNALQPAAEITGVSHGRPSQRIRIS